MKSIILTHMDEAHWEAEAITATGHRPLTRSEAMRAIAVYLIRGNGPFRKRVSSFFKRLCTARLKLSGLSGENRGTTTSPT